MKKITPLILFFMCIVVNSQVTISESFDSSTSLPSGWLASRFSGTSIQSCNGNSFRTNLRSGTSTTTGWLSTPNFTNVSNGNNLVVTFDYKIINYFTGSNPTIVPTSSGWGNIHVQISQDNGVNWTTVYTVDDSNHITSINCTNKSFTINSSLLPNGSDFKMRFLGTWNSGDYYIYIDNVNASQSSAAPNCNAILSIPANNASNVSVTSDLNWTAANGFPTGYNLTIGTNPSGTNVLNNQNVGNVTSYDLPQLLFNTTYYVTIIPYNGNGTATGCSQYSFTTIAAPPIGNVCENPIIISSLPFSTTNNTSNFGDDYSGGQGTNCGSNTQFYLDGDDVVYKYSASFTGNINIKLTPSTTADVYSGIFVYGSCSDIGTNCLAGVANGTANIREINSFSVTSGEDYFIVISSYAPPQSIGYTLNIVENTCTNPTANFLVIPNCVAGNQFFVNTEITNFGTASSVTVSDNFGSTPVVLNTTSNVQFGPFQNNNSVIITIQNNQDSNCTLNSSFITQQYCPPSNDECTGSINLAIGSNFNSNLTVSTNQGALISSIPNPSCGGSVFKDVWYNAVVPNSGNITIEINQEPGGLTDTALQLYSGNCSNLVALQCGDNESSSSGHPLVTLTGRTPGEVIYIRVWDFGGNNENLFRISAYDCSLGTSAPTGSATQSFCLGATVASLSATGTSLQWYSAATGGTLLTGTTALVNGTSYYASQTISGCESNSRLQVTATINPNSPTPTGFSSQSFPVQNASNAVIESIQINPTNVTWYATFSNALNGINPLPSGTVLVNGATYYAVNFATGCKSSPFAVTVMVLLGNDEFEFNELNYFPNPVTDYFYIENSSLITSLKVINLLGQDIFNVSLNNYITSVDLTTLEKGTYFVVLNSDEKTKIFPIIKN